MQDRDKMHPQDMRNLILFIVLSVALWLAYDHFVMKPKVAQMRAVQEAAQAKASSGTTHSGVPAVRPRDQVTAETARTDFSNAQIRGSVNLKGGRIDDLHLKDYYRTVERKKTVALFSPAGTPYPRYAEYGWVAADKNVRVPGADTIWRVTGSTGHLVELSWDNGAGLRFERSITLDEDFGFTVTQRVVNNSGMPVTLHPYALVTEHGLPEDYFGRRVIHEGPVGYIGGKLVERSYKDLEKSPEERFAADSGWIGLTEKYWLTALVPEAAETVTYRFVSAPSPALTPASGPKYRYQADILGAARTVASGQSATFSSHLFAGAKKLSLLEAYEKKWAVPHFDLAVDFGWFYFLTKPFFWVLNLFYGWVGNFGIAIIMFTVLLRIAVFPLANTSFRSFAKMRQVGPKMNELRAEYGSDKQKLQEELVKLYQREKVNPMAGCLPILVQIPIFFALFKVLSNTIEMRHAPFFGWIQDLSAPDPTTVFNLFGLIPWTPPGFLMIGAWPCLMLLTMIVQRKLSPPPQDKLQAQMIAAMPYFMTFILAKFASGLVIYWTFNNLFSVIQQYIITRSMGVDVPLLGPDKEKKAVEEAVEKGPAVHPQLEMIEEEVEEALFGDEDEDSPKTGVSKPRPKKKKKKK